MTTETGIPAKVWIRGDTKATAVEGFSNYGRVARWVTSDGYEVLVPWTEIKIVALEKTNAGR